MILKRFNLNIFSRNLRKIINEKFDGNLSAYAREAQVPVSTLDSYVKKKHKHSPRTDMIIRLAHVAGVSVEWLCTSSVEKHRT